MTIKMQTGARDNPALLPKEQVKALLANALAVLWNRARVEDDDDDDDEGPLSARRHRALVAAREALRFVMADAASRDDAAMLAEVEGVLELMDHYQDDPLSVVDVVAEAAGHLANVGASPPRDAQRLARHPLAEVRYRLAMALKPTSPEHVALLQTLAADAERRVRDAAHANLGPTHAPPWWSGLFDSDPMARLSRGESPGVVKALADIQKLNAGTWWEQKTKTAEARQWPRLVAALPDVLALEVSERLLRVTLLPVDTKAAVLANMLTRQGALPPLLRVVDHAGKRLEDRFGLEGAAKEAATLAPREALDAMAGQLADLAVAAPLMERRDRESAASLRAELAGTLWGTSAPPGPLLERVLHLHGEVDEEHPPLDWVASRLMSALVASTLDAKPLVPTVLEALSLGATGPWRGVANQLVRWVDGAPRAQVRAAALQAVRGTHTRAIQWGLKQLLFHKTHVPKEDGSLLDMLERFWDQPAARAAMMGDAQLRLACVLPLRGLLRSGACTPVEAEWAAAVVSRLYGGAAQHNVFGGQPDDLDDVDAKERKALRSEHKGLLGPRQMQGPLTDQEWAAVRKARRAALDGGSWHQGQMFVTQPRVRHEEDRAQLREAVAAMREGKTRAAMNLAMGLNCNAAPEDVPTWEALLACGDPAHRGWLKRAYHQTRARMGLPPVASARSAAAHEDDAGWEDDPL